MVAVSALIGAGGQLAELLMQYMQSKKQDKRYQSSIQRAEQDKREDLLRSELQRQQNLRMAREGRGDVYGNRTVYKPGIGWTTELTPTSAKLVGGEQAARLRSQELARQSSEDYQQARNKYLNAPRESEEGLQDEYTRLGLIGRRKGLDEAGTVIARQMLRQGIGGDLSDVYEEGDRLYADSLEEQLLKGKMAGRDAYQNAEKFRTGQGLSEMARFSGMAGSGAGAGLEGLESERDDAQKTLLAALGSGSGGGSDWLSSAYGSYPRSSPNYNISGLADALAKLFEEDSSTHAKNQSRLTPSGGTYG